MTPFYGQRQRALQERFETRAIADRHAETIVHAEILDDEKRFIEARDLFFLSTVDAQGQPTVSYKGGAPGFVRVLDAKTLAFPSYDGNGMFLSVGNLMTTTRVGLLFIDFETPHRLRLHGLASVREDDPLLGECPGADLIVRVAVADLFVNCPRYVHRYRRVETSRYVPRVDGSAPLAQWKRIDVLQDALPARDRADIAGAGGEISVDAYLAKIAAGDA